MQGSTFYYLGDWGPSGGQRPHCCIMDAAQTRQATPRLPCGHSIPSPSVILPQPSPEGSHGVPRMRVSYPDIPSYMPHRTIGRTKTKPHPKIQRTQHSPLHIINSITHPTTSSSIIPKNPADRVPCMRCLCPIIPPLLHSSIHPSLSEEAEDRTGPYPKLNLTSHTLQT